MSFGRILALRYYLLHCDNAVVRTRMRIEISTLVGNRGARRKLAPNEGFFNNNQFCVTSLWIELIILSNDHESTRKDCSTLQRQRPCYVEHQILHSLYTRFHDRPSPLKCTIRRTYDGKFQSLHLFRYFCISFIGGGAGEACNPISAIILDLSSDLHTVFSILEAKA